MAILNHPSDRRVSRRRSLTEIPELLAVKVQSEEVAVVDVSRGGILIECGLRLPPGTGRQLELHTLLDGLLRVRGRVMRCEVTSVSRNRLLYRVAFAFSHNVDFITDEGLLATQLEHPAASAFPIQPPGDGVQVEVVELDCFALNSW